MRFARQVQEILQCVSARRLNSHTEKHGTVFEDAKAT